MNGFLERFFYSKEREWKFWILVLSFIFSGASLYFSTSNYFKAPKIEAGLVISRSYESNYLTIAAKNSGTDIASSIQITVAIPKSYNSLQKEFEASDVSVLGYNSVLATFDSHPKVDEKKLVLVVPKIAPGETFFVTLLISGNYPIEYPNSVFVDYSGQPIVLTGASALTKDRFLDTFPGVLDAFEHDRPEVEQFLNGFFISYKIPDKYFSRFESFLMVDDKYRVLSLAQKGVLLGTLLRDSTRDHTSRYIHLLEQSNNYFEYKDLLFALYRETSRLPVASATIDWLISKDFEDEVLLRALANPGINLPAEEVKRDSSMMIGATNALFLSTRFSQYRRGEIISRFSKLYKTDELAHTFGLELFYKSLNSLFGLKGEVALSVDQDSIIEALLEEASTKFHLATMTYRANGVNEKDFDNVMTLDALSSAIDHLLKENNKAKYLFGQAY